MGSAKTPLMQQYESLKSQVEDSLLFFRMGDFYELFGEDAVIASQKLGITLTSRDKSSENPIPMAGVPHHSADSYVSTLLDAGHKVAIGEQVEDPKATKGIVKREITRVLTPAIRYEMDQLDSPHLATLIAEPSKKNEPKVYRLVLLQLNTGEVQYQTIESLEDFQEALKLSQVRHFLNFGQSTPVDFIEALKRDTQVLIEPITDHYLSDKKAQELIQSQYEIKQLDSLFPYSSLVLGLGIILKYLKTSQKIDVFGHLKVPTLLKGKQKLRLPSTAISHLDLFPTPDQRPNLFETLTKTLGKTKTALGNRRLKSWLAAPDTQLKAIHEKQELIGSWSKSSSTTESIQSSLSHVLDIERILSRVASGYANPRDIRGLGVTLDQMSSLLESLKKEKTKLGQKILKSLKKNQKELAPLVKKILEQIKEDAPLSQKDAKIFNLNVSKELDSLISLTENAEKHLIEIEQSEREKTKISNLKIKYNRVFGYFIEVTKSHLDKIPKNYQRKQSTVNSERFITEDLKKLEDEILSAQSKRKALESHLFSEFLETVKTQTQSISEAAELISQIDAYQTLATISSLKNWVMPNIDESKELSLTHARHPVVAHSMGGEFIPNSIELNETDRATLLITGPNMGGKSTIMRQTALIVILGQMGCAVPAKAAKWGVFHSIYTRMGANDSIAQGQSTFMVEMSELAFLLHHANNRSLIILDEIGRGTSTYDGMSMAWSTLEWICNQIKARTLFATHYHELTELDQTLPSLKNVHMEVECESKTSDLRFLYTLGEGKANESFGIQVAQMAGIPKKITKRAWKVLSQLESKPQSNAVDTSQLSLFQNQVPDEEIENTKQELEKTKESLEEIVQALESIDIDHLTPIQALNTLSDLKENQLN